jgi:hypothetical protein
MKEASQLSKDCVSITKMRKYKIPSKFLVLNIFIVSDTTV